MANNSINLKEALAILESYQWVSLRFITADVQKGVGGLVIEIPRCRICRQLPQAQQAATDAPISKTTTAKKANHNLNFTRNIELPNRKIRSIHPVLITHINQIPVL
jgi:hypothetical protein